MIFYVSRKSFGPILSAKFMLTKKVGQMPVDQMPVGQMPVGQMPVGQKPVGQLPVEKRHIS
jgi:hypothetical protein